MGQERVTNPKERLRGRLNLKVAITHVRQAYSQPSFGLPLRSNGLHRKKSDHFDTRNDQRRFDFVRRET